MITVIVGTNRPLSNSELVARNYLEYLSEVGVDGQMLRLCDLPRDFVFEDAFNNRRAEFSAVIEQYIHPVEKFVFVIPEYNGGFPGVLKAFIDVVPPSEFHGKKAGLVGLSSGMAGALRPMDQFTNVLNYLKVNVLFSKPKLSSFEKLVDDQGRISEPRAVALLRQHVELMASF